MSTILWIVLGLFTLFPALFVWGWFRAISASIKLNRQLDEAIAPVLAAVASSDPSSEQEILKFSENPATRNHLYEGLKKIGKQGLVPAEYRTLEKIAESDLVRWLMHPNELQSAPAEIACVRPVVVSDAGKSGRVYLFRFRVDPPHWASESGWMAGVAGPYWDDDETHTAAGGTFSELTPFDRISEEQHVEALRAALAKRGLVVPS